MPDIYPRSIEPLISIILDCIPRKRADKFDGDLQDIFDLQDKVTSIVVATIAPTIEQAEIGRSTGNVVRGSARRKVAAQIRRSYKRWNGRCWLY
jgi:hypothetical protein